MKWVWNRGYTRITACCNSLTAEIAIRRNRVNGARGITERDAYCSFFPIPRWATTDFTDVTESNAESPAGRHFCDAVEGN